MRGMSSRPRDVQRARRPGRHHDTGLHAVLRRRGAVRSAPGPRADGRRRRTPDVRPRRPRRRLRRRAPARCCCCNPYNPLGASSTAPSSSPSPRSSNVTGRASSPTRSTRRSCFEGAPHPVRVAVAGHRGAHGHPRVGQQGLEPARPQVRPGGHEQRRGPGRVAAHPAAGPRWASPHSGSRRPSPHTATGTRGWRRSAPCSRRHGGRSSPRRVDGCRGCDTAQRGHLPRVAGLHRAGARRRPGRLVPRARPGRPQPWPTVPRAGPPLRTARTSPRRRRSSSSPSTVCAGQSRTVDRQRSHVIVRSTGSVTMA